MIGAIDQHDLTIRRSLRARRLILRLSVQGDGVEVVAPRRASEREIARFVERHRGWIDQRLAARPQSVPFAPGAVIPFRGVPHGIELGPSLRGTVSREGGTITVPSLPEHLPRRLRDYLTREARAALLESIAHRAETLGVPLPPVSLRDTTSRWGSCSAKGALSFSWRLILAPPDILDYVAAHEMAHLRHMDHGRQFWDLCARLAPHTPDARAWLKKNGASLHRYG